MTITVTETINDYGVTRDVDEHYEFYSKVFADIDELSVQKHLMEFDDFDDLWSDPLVIKFFAHDDAGELVGMSVMGNHFSSWPLLSERYFKKHYPDHVKRDAIWYIGFTGATQPHVFHALVEKMYAHVGKDGIVVVDFSHWNVMQNKMPQKTVHILKQIEPETSIALMDRQSFYALRFDGIEEADCDV